MLMQLPSLSINKDAVANAADMTAYILVDIASNVTAGITVINAVTDFSANVTAIVAAVLAVNADVAADDAAIKTA